MDEQNVVPLSVDMGLVACPQTGAAMWTNLEQGEMQTRHNGWVV
jgi:hypothetical protein